MDYPVLFKSISEPTRLDIVRELTDGEKCVCKIYEKLDLPQNLASHHLSVLRDCGLITARKEGRWVYYSLNKKMFKKLDQFFSKILNPAKQHK